MELTSTLPSQFNGKQLTALYEAMLANGDEKNATKILDLYEKMKKSELIVSFAGHFSAGKSSMINQLLGESILPQSPIPTSANVVKINSGEGVARVYFHHEAPIEYKEPYDIEMIKDYCKDKDTIKKIELSTAKKIVPDHTAVFDTPGIDAADDADRLITEASLHLVDVLFYVMDYNHVQSEVNLQFLNSLDKKGIPFLVIINQIDKHDEAEIPFEQFDESIKQTFDQWNIHPETIFYSSLIDASAPYNQFPAIKQKLSSLMTTNRESYYSITSLIKQVVNDHHYFLSNEFEEKISVYENINENQEAVYLQKEKMEGKITEIEKRVEQFKHDFQHELQTTLKNAYIMPSELRDKAQAFLESLQTGFKVGFLGSKKKTNEEKESRLNAFLYPLRENGEAVIQWKLRDKFTNLLKKYSLNDNEWLQQTQQISIEYKEADLFALVKTGAKVTGEYVLNFTNDVSSDMKQKYKQEAVYLLNTIMNELKKRNQSIITGLEAELAKLDKISDRIKNREVLKQTWRSKQHLLEQILHGENQDVRISLDHVIKKRYESIKVGGSVQKSTEPTSAITQPEQDEPKVATIQSSDNILENIDQTIKAITGLPGFQSIVNDLKGKQSRLANRTYTIALFGAFSAGKSSFANALIGESVLPVSPNPTTAAINRICPPTSKYEHGTVVVNMKSAETLRRDLVSITKDFSPSNNNFASLLEWVQEKEIHLSNGLQHMYQAYLQAMIKGYRDNQVLIGKQITITMDEFSTYVSDETKACYVDSIDLYYDSPLTQQGITLVDTPGADSVNSRHTNVAFDYIKHADAILYVTYYNHALSRADKDFLMQLGRVKDAFQLDKMFFIVNAADLAKDHAELDLVTKYVEEQLVQLGIRFPKLFPLSSKQAIEAKKNKHKVNDQMNSFEHKLYRFIHDDLALLSIQAATLDIKRAYQSLTNYIETASLNEQEKESYRLELFGKREKLEQVVKGIKIALYMNQIRQKIEKQLYYVLERLSIRFHDMFKEEFNPTTITGSGKQAQDQLDQCLKNLLDYTGYELVQELRAVSLRIESFVQSLAKDVYDRIVEKSGQIDAKLVLPSAPTFDLETPEYEQAFNNVERNVFNKALSSFKGTKSFFVKNEKELMKEEIYQTLAPYANQYMEDNKAIMEQAYLKQWTHIMETIQHEITKNIDAYIDSSLSMMTKTIDMILLTEKHQELASIMNESKIEEMS